MVLLARFEVIQCAWITLLHVGLMDYISAQNSYAHSQLNGTNMKIRCLRHIFGGQLTNSNFSDIWFAMVLVYFYY